MSSADAGTEPVPVAAVPPSGWHCSLPTPLPTAFGLFTVFAVHEPGVGDHLVLLHGEPIRDRRGVLARLHSECLTGDAFGSRRCDCGEQLHAALAAIAAEPSGVLVYLRQEGRGIGLLEKLRAYVLQDRGLDTVDANRHLGHADDPRSWEAAAIILDALGVGSLRLLTNNPAKVRGLVDRGIEVEEVVPLTIAPNPFNDSYLAAKAARMGHRYNAD